MGVENQRMVTDFFYTYEKKCSMGVENQRMMTNSFYLCGEKPSMGVENALILGDHGTQAQ